MVRTPASMILRAKTASLKTTGEQEGNRGEGLLCAFLERTQVDEQRL
jgi:hypothetical protein